MNKRAGQLQFISGKFAGTDSHKQYIYISGKLEDKQHSPPTWRRTRSMRVSIANILILQFKPQDKGAH